MLPKEKVGGNVERKILEELVEIKWSCITDPELRGLFYADVAESIKQNVIKLSGKTVHVKFFVNGEKVLNGEILVKHGEILTIEYEVEGEGDCSH